MYGCILSNTGLIRHCSPINHAKADAMSCSLNSNVVSADRPDIPWNDDDDGDDDC